MSRAIKGLEGNKFGKLTVLKETGRDKNGAVLWDCKCDCGNFCKCLGHRLLKGSNISCGCAYRKDITGKKFGKIQVVSFSHYNKNKISMWNGVCDCGNKVIVNSNYLHTGGTKSCGCLFKETVYHNNVNETIIASAKSIYKTSHYLDGNISFEDFFGLSQKNCYMCGVKPGNIINLFLTHKNSSDFAKTNGNFIYNGLDRIDISFPHNKNNCMPCCIICNRFHAKRNIYKTIDAVKTLKENPNLNLIFNNLNLDDIKKIYKKTNSIRKNKYILSKISQIKQDAKKRSILFLLSDLEIAKLIISPCAYCEYICQDDKSEMKDFNGIDRSDNDLGYTLDNCVACCKFCNFTKNDLPYDDFINWIIRIKTYNFNNNILQNIHDCGIILPPNI